MYLSEKSPPEILDSKPQHFYVKLNDTICLPCKLKTQYTGEYRILSYWSRNGNQVIHKWSRYSIENDCMRIVAIKSWDHANFTCVATNQLGSTRVERVLHVTDRVEGETNGIYIVYCFCALDFSRNLTKEW